MGHGDTRRNKSDRSSQAVSPEDALALSRRHLLGELGELEAGEVGSFAEEGVARCTREVAVKDGAAVDGDGRLSPVEEPRRIHQDDRSRRAGAGGDVVVRDGAAKPLFKLGVTQDRVAEVTVNRAIEDLAPETLERAAALGNVGEIDCDLQHAAVFAVAMPEAGSCLTAIGFGVGDFRSVVGGRKPEVAFDDPQQREVQAPVEDGPVVGLACDLRADRVASAEVPGTFGSGGQSEGDCGSGGDHLGGSFDRQFVKTGDRDAVELHLLDDPGFDGRELGEAGPVGFLRPQMGGQKASFNRGKVERMKGEKCRQACSMLQEAM